MSAEDFQEATQQMEEAEKMGDIKLLKELIPEFLWCYSELKNELEVKI